MARIERTIRVGVPTQLAYELWSRPEEFPYFMDGVVAVRDKGSGLFRFTTSKSDRTEHWTARLQREAPHLVRWRTTDRGRFLGQVVLRTTADGSEVTFMVDYEPRDVTAVTQEPIPPLWDVTGDLIRFKSHAEDVQEQRLLDYETLHVAV